jgi:GH24 family phage-related lysozyme (muramidase)
MTPRVGPRATALMHHFEGCKLKAYLCPAKVWTIGWGNTRYEDGRPVRQGDQITQARANELFQYKLRTEFEPGVIRAIGDAATTPAQFGAMVALAYNIGVGAFSRSRVASNHRAGRYEAASVSFMTWVRGGRPLRVISGLVRRRKAERALYEARLDDFDRMIGYRP